MPATLGPVVLLIVVSTMMAFAEKPPSCPRYPATVYVATSAAYGLTGDGTTTSVEWIDGIPYTKYVDGQGGVQAYVNGGTCGGAFFFSFGQNGSRKLNVVFQNWQNNGAFGPPSGGLPVSTAAGGLFLRGFSFNWPGVTTGDTYSTMMPVNGLALSPSGGVLRYEPMTSDYLTDNPDFPTYPDMNTPCVTSAARMSVISPTETLVTPMAINCVNPNNSAYSGPLVSLLVPRKGALANVGQYGMDFNFRIVVNGWTRY